MIDFKRERSCDFSTKQILSVLDFAAQAANDNGFMSHHVFRKGMMVFAAVLYYPDKKDDIMSLVGDGYDISVAFDKLNEDGLFDEMYDAHKESLEYLSEVGEEWLDDSMSYAHSARGLLDAIGVTSNTMIQNAVQKLQGTLDSKDLQRVFEVGKALGVDLKQDSSLKDGDKLKLVEEEKPKPKRTRRKAAPKKKPAEEPAEK